jgi:chromosome segregation protein
VFLRSLSLRGFKSFADKTVLEVEPGITVIVGPNGSGKSNVVDALAWVLGTHSAKKVRGGSMADVIFAGSPTRNRANHCRVEIVIDNSDGRLTGAGLGTAASAAEFSEVRVARVIHADGETSYEINGEEVRALDVQELLSDTGLGRELHTIVGQGQLDEILNAKPEERRRYIEEAAGILKHRRRRERQAEDDGDQPHPKDREAVHPLVLPPQRPRTWLEAVPHAPAQEDRDHVGDVEADHRDRRDRQVRGGVEQRRQGEDHGAGDAQPDRVGRRTGSRPRNAGWTPSNWSTRSPSGWPGSRW